MGPRIKSFFKFSLVLTIIAGIFFYIPNTRKILERILSVIDLRIVPLLKSFLRYESPFLAFIRIISLVLFPYLFFLLLNYLFNKRKMGINLKSFIAATLITVITVSLLALIIGTSKSPIKPEYITCGLSANETMNLKQAVDIAERFNCTNQGELLTQEHYCNNLNNTWWIEIEPYVERPGCNPACVIDLESKTAKVDWRCETEP